MKHFEFQNYIVDFIQVVHTPRLVAYAGIYGYVKFNCYPVQVKQQEHVSSPEIKKFESAVQAEKKDKVIS